MSVSETLGQSIKDALEKYPTSDVLSVLTGSFVGLVVEMLRRGGLDTTSQITIDGGLERDITIHAPKVKDSCGDKDSAPSSAKPTEPVPNESVDRDRILRLIAVWEARSRDALPADAMLVNLQIRELRTLLS